MKNKKFDVIYGIDMGLPKKGFFGWRWDLITNEITPYDNGKFITCAKDIAKDHKDKQVGVGIEAPLWGGERTQKEKDHPENSWSRRFKIKNNKSEANFEEYEWFSSSGASVALMTQHFLCEVAKSAASQKDKRIELVEAYISGANSAKEKILKPNGEKIFAEGGPGCSHSKDALEVLAMSQNFFENEFKYTQLQKALNKLTHLKYQFKKEWDIGEAVDMKEATSSFCLGVIMLKNDLFKLYEGKVLVSSRLTNVLPTPKKNKKTKKLPT